MENNPPASGDHVMAGLYVAYVIIMLVSLSGNCLVVHIVFRRENMRTSTNYLFANMAVADLINTVFSMPFWSYFICLGRVWSSGVLGAILCKVASSSCIVTVLASVMTLVVIAADRFVAIFYPLRRINIVRNTRHITAIIWIISLLFGLPSAGMYEILEGSGKLQCLNQLVATNMILRKAYYIVMFAILFAMPILVMSLLYFMIACKLWFRRVPGNQTNATRRATLTVKRKVVRMLIVILLAFVACWLPVHIEWFKLVFSPAHVWREELSIMLAHANSALNPCLYFLLNERFRECLVETLTCRGPALSNRHAHLTRTTRTSSHVMHCIHSRHRSRTYRVARPPTAFSPTSLLNTENNCATIRRYHSRAEDNEFNFSIEFQRTIDSNAFDIKFSDKRTVSDEAERDHEAMINSAGSRTISTEPDSVFCDSAIADTNLTSSGNDICIFDERL